MAEVFGVVAGVAGIASLIPKLISGIDTLRDVQRSADKAPAELDALADELKVLKRFLEEAARNEHFVLEMGNASLGQVISGLEKLKRKFAAQLEPKKTKMPKIFLFRHWKEDVEALQDSIRTVKLDLIILRLLTALSPAHNLLSTDITGTVQKGTALVAATTQFTLSQCAIPSSATIELFVLATQARFSLRPAFEVEHIVRYTSPGFETLLRYEKDIITVEEARDKFLDLFRSDSTFKNHVNPAGHSYIEELLRVPRWGPVDRAELAPPSSPDWIAEDIVEDPFFLEYLGKLLKNNQGFADMSPLHTAVLLGSDESFYKWLSSSAKDEKNFLDQTPMHLATSNCQRLVALIKADHNLDATDIYGITPLMYAAGSNSEDCFIALLEYGAKLDIQCKRYNRTFMQYAAVRGNWDLLFTYLCWVEKKVEEDALEKIIIEGWAQMLTTWYYVAYPDYLGKRKVSFQQFLAKCGSVDFMIKDQDRELQDNTLLHYVRSAEEIDILLEKGFTRINHVNSAGHHALITAIYNHCSVPDVARRLLAIGVEIDIQDNSHHTALHHMLDSLLRSVSSNTWGAIDTLCVLLANDADPLCIDNCRCPCSLGGCLPSSVLCMQAQTGSFYVTTVPIWSLEWLTLILKHRNLTEARVIVLSLIRRAKFDDLGMTHVCCGRRQGYFSPPNSQGHAPMPDEDIDAILEEEFEFIDMLQEEMALSSAKPYEELVDEWIQQIKAALKKSCMEASEKDKSIVKEKVIHGPIYEVDSKNDCFRFRPLYVYCPNRNPAESAKREIVEYIHWMEYEYHCGKTSALCKGVGGSTKDDWYLSRLSWLFKLVNELGISMAELTASIREKNEPDPECLVKQPIGVEEITKHLIASWRVWEGRRDL
ncbi:Ankyrin repeat-containing protein [Glarea lozoyensis ATCC 20868]|uniref:Ankyrin repeat-containing protein n=1 Tax=Glarea lozoyensis (strain ATCC 20868 / MF5171) TaxID=1116229 RepID=S3DEN9_GLAL2|nr:Ankyrin repeat-containing protein [Glarea lozoyensis ATCC 20868]EPE36215.1 Ankyrin repeat-containing protein [Glarea lozoyensis ATCC 20868]